MTRLLLVLWILVGCTWCIDILAPPTTPLHNISAACMKDTEAWMEALAIFGTVSEVCVQQKKCTATELATLEKNLWAVQELDSFGRFPSPGMLEITTLYDGSYQECSRIDGEKYATNYCYLVLKPGKNNNSTSFPLPIRLAVCMPNSCNHKDMINIFNQLSPLPFTAVAAFCVKNDIPKDAAFWGFSIFMIVMVSIAILATSVDYIRENVYQLTSDKEKNIFLKLLLAFSFWTNAGLLLSVAPQKHGFIKSLDCIRLFSMCWVLTGHSFIYLLMADSFMPVIQFPKQFWNHLLLNAFVSVDTFFVLSGIVLAYLFFKEKPKRQMIMNPITWILFYVHRYLRLTPPIMLFIGFFTVYAPYIEGPFSASEANQLIQQADACKTSWWRNLIYINNFGDNAATCYGPTWYLAADTQMYLIAPIILIGLYFSFAAGTFFVVAGCIASITTTYILYFTYDLPADMFGNGDGKNFFTMIYEKPWIRCPPYLVGLLVGYLIATFGKRQIRLNWALQITGWVICFVIAGFCLFSTYDYDKGAKWSIMTRATFYNFHRLGWAIAVSWVVVANHMGWGGPINNFMSHPIWQPFGRLSYCAYIVHWMVLYYFLNAGGRPLHYSSAWQVFIYFAVPSTFMSYLLAFFWSCLFEVSTLKWEKMLIEAIVGKGGVRPSAPVEDKPKTSWDEVETGKMEVVTIEVKKIDEDSESTKF